MSSLGSYRYHALFHLRIFTLYTRTLPLDVACRVWDMFCRDGEVFLFRTALGVSVCLSVCVCMCVIIHMYIDIDICVSF